jgi:hypothetical protein
MYPVPIPSINPDEHSKREERKHMIAHGKSFGPNKKTDEDIKDSIYHAFWKDGVLRAMTKSMLM